jgi:hypothetical protein
MLVTMKVKIGGYRDGEPWPDVGDMIDLPAHEAQDLVAAGYAKGPTDDNDTDTAGSNRAKNRAVKDQTGSGGDGPTADDSDTDTASDTPAPRPRRR